MYAERLPITPRTKVAELLRAYPELEEPLIDCAPAFKKLRNPVLRKTVAQVTSLAQAARVGGIPAKDLINRLRREVGQDMLDSGEDAREFGDQPTSPPAWFNPDKIVDTLDARPLIEAGEQPIGRVMSELKKLKDEEIFEVITPFNPAPLIDLTHEKGFTAWQKQDGSAEIHTFFRKL